MKQVIMRLLESTNREGIDKLSQNLEDSGFFESPASTKYHGSYNGGLARHSYNVYKNYLKMISDLDFPISRNSVIIVSLLHDLCKLGLYSGDKIPYSFNVALAKRGHARFSIERIEEFIKLEDIEREIIQYHMGIYGTEFSYSKEYTVSEMLAIFNKHKVVKLFHIADEIAAQITDQVNQSSGY